MKQWKIAVGDNQDEMVMVMAGKVEGEWKFPELININVVQEDETEINRVYILSENGSKLMNDPNYILKVITRILLQLGIPASIKGFYYLREAINLTIYDISLVEAVTTRLYPTLADMYHTVPFRVERTMRYAIEMSWHRGDVDKMEEIFGYSIEEEKGRPTNTEFIAMIADRIRLHHLI